MSTLSSLLAKRWLADNDLRKARDMSLEDVLKRSEALRSKASREFDDRTIMAHGLDNPSMADHAIATMASDARRNPRRTA